MKMLFLFITLSVIISGCAPGQVTSGPIQAGQWRPAMSIGNGRYVISGWDTQDAISGGNATCNKIGRSFVAENIVPNTRRDSATITFRCQ